MFSNACKQGAISNHFCMHNGCRIMAWSSTNLLRYVAATLTMSDGNLSPQGPSELESLAGGLQVTDVKVFPPFKHFFAAALSPQRLCL